MANFTAEVDQWVRETQQRMDAVLRMSIQRTITAMQVPQGKGGNLPVDTGFLRNSLNVTTGSPVPATQSNPYASPNSVNWSTSSVTATISGLHIGTTLYATYAANYALHVEYGANGRAGTAFVRTAAAKWPQIVNQAAAELRQRVLSRT